jgi:hypothetical protein
MHNSVRNSNCVLRNAREHPDDVQARARNPVILLTARELFGQFKLGGYDDQYGPKANYAHMVAIRGDLQELADFTATGLSRHAALSRVVSGKAQGRSCGGFRRSRRPLPRRLPLHQGSLSHRGCMFLARA